MVLPHQHGMDGAFAARLRAEDPRAERLGTGHDHIRRSRAGGESAASVEAAFSATSDSIV